MVTYALTSPAVNINKYWTSKLLGYLYIKGKKQPPPYDPPSFPNYD